MFNLRAKSSYGLLIVSYLDYPSCEGLSTRINGLAKVLIENGVKVKVIAPIARNEKLFSSNISKDIIIQRIDLRRFRSKNPHNLPSKFILLLLFYLISSVLVIKDFIKNGYLIQYQSIYSAFPALIAKLVLQAQIIGDDIVLIHPVIDIPILQLSDVVITPSCRSYRYAKNLGKTPIYVPNGIDIQESIKKNLSSDSRKSFLFVGSLSFYQNMNAVEKMFEIASKLDDENLEFQFLIIGGPLYYAKHLMTHPLVEKSKITFLGRVSNQRLKELYCQGTFGILPFFEDAPLIGGQRTKALEYFANNLLVISGPEGIKGIEGLIPGIHFIQSNSVNEMSKVLRDCLSDAREFEPIRNNGKQFVFTNYCWDNLAEKYLDLISNLFSDQELSGQTITKNRVQQL